HDLATRSCRDTRIRNIVGHAHRLPGLTMAGGAPALQFETNTIRPINPFLNQTCPHRVLTKVMPFLFRRFIGPEFYDPRSERNEVTPVLPRLPWRPQNARSGHAL